MIHHPNKNNLREYRQRRKLNFFSLIVITLLSALVTLYCSISGAFSSKVELLSMVTVALAVLCFVQIFRMRRSYRTLPLRGLRRKKVQRQDKPAPEEEPASNGAE